MESRRQIIGEEELSTWGRLVGRRDPILSTPMADDLHSYVGPPYNFKGPEDADEEEFFEVGYRYIQTFVLSNCLIRKALRKFDQHGVSALDVLEEIRDIVYESPECWDA